jgi:tRNA pseudouridine13 synthase
MKIKERPEDFQVEELTEVQPQDSGPFAFYRLKKRNLNTLDALQIIRQRWRIQRQRLSFGGLKDKHAETIQHFTILHGPERRLTHTGLRVEFLGRTAEPFTSKDIRANRFRLTIRDLSPDDIQVAERALEEIRRDGIPNYFHEQRFGSVGQEGGFMARHLVHGRYEEALKLALTTPYEFDRGPEKKEKAALKTHWGDWKGCLARLKLGQAREIAEYLSWRPTDFRGALRLIKPELRQFYLNAYQSHLWNRMLVRWLEVHLQPNQLRRSPHNEITPIDKRTDDVLFYHDLTGSQRAELVSLRLPLPTTRTKIEPTDPRWPVIQDVLAEEGIEMRDLKVKAPREWFFSKGERAAVCLPHGLSYESKADERHRGKLKMVLVFDLPRGSYATLVVAGLLANSGACGQEG